MNKTPSSLTSNQTGFIDFLVRSNALTFGDFVLKSGRKAPYFINTGKFDDGTLIMQLGEFYANHIVQIGLGSIQTIFGPAYKGIPLAVATSIAMQRVHGVTMGFCFDRKEAKTHGDGGRTVGKKLQDGDHIVLVEDVITAGTTMREIIPFINAQAKVKIEGVVLAVDRCERGATNLSAVQEAEQTLGLKVCPLVRIHDIVGYLSKPNSSGLVLDAKLLDRIAAYLNEYGA